MFRRLPPLTFAPRARDFPDYPLDISGRMGNIAFSEWVLHELAHAISAIPRRPRTITGHAAAVIEDARVTYNLQVMLQAGKTPPGFFIDPPVDPTIIRAFYPLLDGR